MAIETPAPPIKSNWIEEFKFEVEPEISRDLDNEITPEKNEGVIGTIFAFDLSFDDLAESYKPIFRFEYDPLMSEPFSN